MSATPFRCTRGGDGCGDEWEKDPRLIVACPTCRRAAGRRCVRPSEHECEPHVARRTLAFEVAPCRCLALWDAANPNGEAPTEQQAQTEMFA